MELTRFVQTARHLKPIQIWKRLQPQTKVSTLPVVWNLKNYSSRPRFLESLRNGWNGLEFQFMNLSHDAGQSWDPKNKPKLFTYHLHYFDDGSLELFERWRSENPPGFGVGWDPYVLSRRIPNWIKFHLSKRELSQELLSSLALQAETLSKRVEWHILGNHILANAVALVFAGTFFGGQNAERWYLEGLKLLEDELHEQILEDGGHFERSPMYHNLILADLIDLKEILNAYGSSSAFLEPIISRMKSWSAVMTHSDGSLGRFNDSIDQQAPQFEYKTLGPGIYHLEESGYVRFVDQNFSAILDLAPIGPEYQPGHAHADTLSFELHHRGNPIVRNSGISTYDICPRRSWERGTESHATVLVDGENSSDVWASFRVGKRARIIDRSVSSHEISAEHDGYVKLFGGCTHRRTWTFGSELKVTDELFGQYRSAEARFPLDARWKVQRLNEKAVLVGRLNIVSEVPIGIEKTLIAESLGCLKENFTLVMPFSGKLITRFDPTNA